MCDLLTTIQSAYLTEGALTVGRIVELTGKPRITVARDILPLLLAGEVRLRDDRKLEPKTSREVPNERG